MLNVIKDEFYYKEISVTNFLNFISSNYYIQLAMSNIPYSIIKDIKENYIILQNQYNSIQFTFSNNLDSKENEIIDIKEVENILKEAVYRQIEELADDDEPIVFENYEVNKRLNIEAYVVIVKSHSYIFRIYQGMLHSTGRISVKFVSVDINMFKAMTSTLKMDLGEV